MRRNIVMKKEGEGVKKNLNRSDLRINRGFELMIRQHNRREKPSEPKSFKVRFGKMISLLKREIHFNFELSLDIKKK
jgi:hypothetical protein